MPSTQALPAHRIGVDENGLGARLGPLVVTGVLARVDERGSRMLSRRLPAALRADLDDSKRLVSHSNVALGEAWARALVPTAATPDELLHALSLDERAALRAPCPEHVEAQCWSVAGETFLAEPELCERVAGHRAGLAARGVELLRVESSVLCTKRLNQSRERGIHRFSADLHAMETLVLSLRRTAGQKVLAVCGKVGGIGEYGKFFGPLSGYLRVVLEEGQGLSAYVFPNVGEIRFLRDADAHDPLVMLASLVGKYVRELLMARIARFYPEAEGASSPSGYHDPVSQAFVEHTALFRRHRAVPDTCFERARVEGSAEGGRSEHDTAADTAGPASP